MQVSKDFTAMSVDFIEEHFHPAGSVEYRIFHGVQFEGNPCLFDLEVKREMRQV